MTREGLARAASSGYAGDGDGQRHARSRTPARDKAIFVKAKTKGLPPTSKASPTMGNEATSLVQTMVEQVPHPNEGATTGDSLADTVFAITKADILRVVRNELDIAELTQTYSGVVRDLIQDNAETVWRKDECAVPKGDTITGGHSLMQKGKAKGKSKGVESMETVRRRRHKRDKEENFSWQRRRRRYTNAPRSSREAALMCMPNYSPPSREDRLSTNNPATASSARPREGEHADQAGLDTMPMTMMAQIGRWWARNTGWAVDGHGHMHSTTGESEETSGPAIPDGGEGPANSRGAGDGREDEEM